MPDIYIELLKKAVENRFGRTPSSTKQYNALSIEIDSALGETLSASTLKRIWGYVDGGECPRTSTLDVMSRYAGAENYAAFVRSAKDSGGIQSDFCGGDALHAEDVAIDSNVELTWLPDRCVQLIYRGDFRWEVIRNHNSKLAEGALVMFNVAMKGQPLYADVRLPGEETFRPYVAGKTSGISFRLL